MFKKESSVIPAAMDESKAKRGVMGVIRGDEERVQRNPGELNALLGAGSEFEGKLRFAGTVRIDGRFKGEILSEDVLIVGEDAEIEGDITVGTAIVNGKIRGTLRARELVELHRPARLLGLLVTPSLLIERGVIFEGTTKMENINPTAVATAPVQPITELMSRG